MLGFYWSIGTSLGLGIKVLLWTHRKVLICLIQFCIYRRELQMILIHNLFIGSWIILLLLRRLLHLINLWALKYFNLRLTFSRLLLFILCSSLVWRIMLLLLRGSWRWSAFKSGNEFVHWRWYFATSSWFFKLKCLMTSFRCLCSLGTNQWITTLNTLNEVSKHVSLFLIPLLECSKWAFPFGWKAHTHSTVVPTFLALRIETLIGCLSAVAHSLRCSLGWVVPLP